MTATLGAARGLERSLRAQHSLALEISSPGAVVLTVGVSLALGRHGEGDVRRAVESWTLRTHYALALALAPALLGTCARAGHLTGLVECRGCPLARADSARGLRVLVSTFCL
jgi:hypothetical protein